MENGRSSSYRIVADNRQMKIVYTFEEGFHRFTIYDSGIAIVNEKMLFEAFKSTKEKGNGLGLVLAKNIANAHGGTVELCKSGRKGFVITLR